MPAILCKTCFEFGEAIRIPEFRQWAMDVGLGYDLAKNGILPMDEVVLRWLLPDDEYLERFAKYNWKGELQSEDVAMQQVSFRRYHIEKVVEFYHRWLDLVNGKPDDLSGLI